MLHRLSNWRVRVKAAEREYQAVRIALDLLGVATVEEIHELASERAGQTWSRRRFMRPS